MAKFEIKWQAPEFKYEPKDVGWYWLSIILASAILALAVWQKNFLFGFFVVVAEILILVWGSVKPRTFNFRINERGIHLGDYKFCPYHDLAAYFIIDDLDGEWAELALIFKSHIHPSLKALLPKKEVENVRKNLKSLLSETEPKQSLIDLFSRFLRF